MDNDLLSRRGVLRAGTAVAAGGTYAFSCQRSRSAAATPRSLPPPLRLPRLEAPTEGEGEEMPTALAPEERVGVAIVGLGRLSLDQILPAFAACKWARPVALVSGDAAKARRVAQQYGISEKNLFDYKNFDQIRDRPEVQAVYIVLPNSMHAEFTVRAAQAGKHVLCEKPMANSVAECQQMIDACHRTSRLLMIAYRCQYEPHHREMIRLARSGELGKLKAISATNGQSQASTDQWRLRRALAGGGALPDVGIYCLNAARYITGEEPIEVAAMTYSTPDDPRFREVEESVNFMMLFPGGVVATCLTSYGLHASKRYRVMGSDAWAEMDPAFPYKGLRLKISRPQHEGPGEMVEKSFEPANQFALEMDHFARCVATGTRPHTPGEEGMQDMVIVEALYRAARERSVVKLTAPSRKDAFRGPPPVAG
jgi:predicted dehydrogenase